MQKSLLFPDRPSKKKMRKKRAQLIMLQHNHCIEKYEDKFDLTLNSASGFSEVDFGSYWSVLKVNGTNMGLRSGN